MGSVHSTANSTAHFDSFVSELADIQYEKSLGTAKFLKTIRCRHAKEGLIVVKIYIKPSYLSLTSNSTNNAPALSLKKYVVALNYEKTILAGIPNAFPYQRIIETDKAGYLLRQYLYSNLYDRISTRPFLVDVEKRWIAFQLLQGLAAAHQSQIYHGDIKTENILVTSWNWVYLTDFSGFKPTYLPEDNPADFAFFYDTSSRRSCYLAPERFYNLSPPVDDGLTPAMDIFSVGCVIAELWLEGTPMFTFSDLLEYRSSKDSATHDILQFTEDSDTASSSPNVSTNMNKSTNMNINTDMEQSTSTDASGTVKEATKKKRSQFNVNSVLNKLPPEVAEHVQRMISLHPHQRESAMENLERFRNSLFPAWFYGAFWETFAELSNNVKGGSIVRDGVAIATDADERVEQLARVLDTLLGGVGDGVSDASIIILSFILSQFRNCFYPSSKLLCLDMITKLSQHLPDDIILDRIVPYLVHAFDDEHVLVKSESLGCLTLLLSNIKTITAGDANLFPEYIIPAIKRIATDSEVLARITLAHCIPTLAENATRFLEMGQLFKSEIVDTMTINPIPNPTYDTSLHDLRELIQEDVELLLTDSSSQVKIALLKDISRLCIFLGRQKTNDVLLSHMITYLNDSDWRLRAAFFESVKCVGVFVGKIGLEEYILPLMVQALYDAEDFVVERVLSSLSALIDLGLLQRAKVHELAQTIAPLLCHPNDWIRYGAMTFIATCARFLSLIDIRCVLYPSIKPCLRSDMAEITEASLAYHTKTPIPPLLLEQAYFWANELGLTLHANVIQGQTTKTKQCQPISNTVEKENIDPDITKDRKILVTQEKQSRGAQVMQEYEEQWIKKLSHFINTNRHEYASGSLTDEEMHQDLDKVKLLKTYIIKSAASKARRDSMPLLSPNVTNSLENLSPTSISGSKQSITGLTPHTVFLTPPNYDDWLLKSAKAGLNYAGSLHHRGNSIVTTNASTGTPTRGPGNLISTSSLPQIMFSRRSSSKEQNQPELVKTSSAISAYNNQSWETGSAVSSLRTTRSQLPVGGVDDVTALLVPDNPIVSNSSTGGRQPSILHDESTHSLKIGPSLVVNAETVTAGRTDESGRIRTTTDSRRRSVQSSDPSAPTLTPNLGLPDQEPLPATSTVSSSGAVPYQHQKELSDVYRPISHNSQPPADARERGVKRFLEKKTLQLFPPPVFEIGPRVSLSISKPISLSRRPSVFYLSSTPATVSASSPPSTSSVSTNDKLKLSGTLIAHFNEHKAAVNMIQVSPDHMFFASGSDDGTIKIWDTSRLERNVTNRSRLTYSNHDGKVRAMTFCEQSHSIASAATDGSIHVWRVECISGGATPKYGSGHTFRSLQLEDDFAVCLNHFDSETQSTLMYATAKGKINAFDLRTRGRMWKLQLPSHYGFITSLVMDPRRRFFVTTTDLGVITLWDVRFCIPLKSWSHPRGARINKASIFGLSKQLQASWNFSSIGTTYSRKCLFLSTDDMCNEVSVWDVESGECKQVWCSLGSLGRNVSVEDAIDRMYPDGLQPSDPPELKEYAQYSINAEKLVPKTSNHSVRSFCYVSDNAQSSALVTCGGDKKIRVWDMQNISESYMLSGLGQDEPSPRFGSVERGGIRYGCEWNASPTSGTNLLRSNLGISSPAGITTPMMITSRPRSRSISTQLFGAAPVWNSGTGSSPFNGLTSVHHQDSINDVVGIMKPYPMIVSAGRDGVVKVWK